MDKIIIDKDGKKFTQYRHNLFVLILPATVTLQKVCLETTDGGLYVKVDPDGTTEILKLVSKNTN